MLTINKKEDIKKQRQKKEENEIATPVKKKERNAVQINRMSILKETGYNYRLV